MDNNWENNVLDDLDKPAYNSYQKHLKGIVYYIIGCIFFVALPFVIMNLFTPDGFTNFMHYPSRSYSNLTIILMFGLAGILGLVILIKLFLYLKNKPK